MAMWSCGGRLWCVRLPCTRRALASCGKSPRAAQMSAGSQTKVGRAECTCDASEAVQMDRYTMGKFPLQPVKRCLHRPRRSVHAASKRCHTAGNQRCGLLKRPERPHRTFDHIWENRSVVPAEIRSTKTETSIAEVKYAFRAWRRAPRLMRKRFAAVSIPSAAPPISRRVGGQVTSRAVKHLWMFPQCSLQLRQDVRADGPIVLVATSNRPVIQPNGL